MSNKLNKNIPKIIVDTESEKRTKGFYPVYTLLDAADKSMDKPITSQPESAQPNPQQKETNIVSKTLKLLTLWLNQISQFLFQQEILDLLNITSGSTTSKTKKELKTYGLIKEHKLQVGKTNLSIWEPTSEAYKKIGLTLPTWESKGGYLHQFCAYHIKKIGIENGHHVEVEYFLKNGKAIDLLLKNENEVIFIEIVTSYPLEKEISNIIKDFSTELKPNLLLMVVQNGKMKTKLEKRILSDKQLDSFRDKIKIVLAGNLITQGKINL